MKPAALAAGALALVLGLLVAVLAAGGILLGASQASQAAVGAPGAPSVLALADIPADYLALYQRAAATCPGMSWALLAAIGSIETDHGRSQLPGVHSGSNFAGAQGPMQFMPPTWASYGLDGDGDGVKDVYNPPDAIFGAANYLCANGAGNPEQLRSAIWNYNHSEAYINDVLALSAQYSAAASISPAGATNGAQLADNPNLILTEWARQDLVAGAVDQRVIDLLASLVANHQVAVSVFKTGHSQYVSGTDRVSNHYYGRAVDIYSIDGIDVTASAEGAHVLAESILQSAPPLRPDELGSPWPDLEQYPGAFHDEDHTDHIHAAYRASLLAADIDGYLALVGAGLQLVLGAVSRRRRNLLHEGALFL